MSPGQFHKADHATKESCERPPVRRPSRSKSNSGIKSGIRPGNQLGLQKLSSGKAGSLGNKNHPGDSGPGNPTIWILQLRRVCPAGSINYYGQTYLHNQTIAILGISPPPPRITKMPDQEYVSAILGITTTSSIILLSFALLMKTRRIATA